MPRFAFIEPSIGSITTVYGPSPWMPTSSLTMREPSKWRRIARSAAASIAVVSSPPRPAPTTGSRWARPGSSTRTPATSSRAARHTRSQLLSNWVEQEAGGELRVEEGRLLRHRLARVREPGDLLDRDRLQQERGRRFAAVDGGNRLLRRRRVGDASGRERLDHTGPEVVARVDARVRPLAVQRDAAVRSGDGLAGDVAELLHEAMRREDLEPRLARGDTARERVRRGRGLGPVGDCRLVAMVSVGDQEGGAERDLAALDRPRARPDAALGDVELGLPARSPEDRVGLVQEEDRLELGVRRPHQAEPSLLRAGVRALVRQHLARLVRRHGNRGSEALAGARDAVRAAVVLRHPPVAWCLVDQDTALAPVGEVAPGLLLGVRQRQVDDVVRIAGEVAATGVGRDHVVRRRDQALEGACDLRVVPERCKRPDRRHPCRLVGVIRTLAQATAWVDEVGLALLFPKADVVLPSLWEQVNGSAEDNWSVRDADGNFVSWTDEMGFLWGAKDELPERGLVCVGKHLARVSACIAPRLVPVLVAANGEAVSEEPVVDAIRELGPLTGPQLREATGLTKKEVDRAVASLH